MTSRRPSLTSGLRDRGMERFIPVRTTSEIRSASAEKAVFSKISNLNLNLNYSARSVKPKITPQ